MSKRVLVVAMFVGVSLFLFSTIPAYSEPPKENTILQEMRLMQEQTKREAEWAKTVSHTALTVTGIILGVVALFSIGFAWISTRRIRDYTYEAKEFRDRTETYMKDASEVISKIASKKEEVDKEIDEKVKQAFERFEEERERSARFSILVSEGLNELLKGNCETALKAWDKALEIDNQSPVVWTHRGVALRRLGRLEESLNSHEEALKLDEKFAPAWSNKASTLIGLNRHEEALLACDKSIKLDKNIAVTWANRSAALGHLGRYESALVSSEKAIELDPTYPPGWLNKGLALISLAKYTESLDAFHETLNLNNNDDVAWYNKACAHSQLGQKPDMLNALEKAIELNPKYKENAKTDKDFEPYGDDNDFRTLVFDENQEKQG